MELPIDCLNLIFSFSTPKDLYQLMLTSKRWNGIIHECNYSWYTMYIRFYSMWNTEMNKSHNGEYNFDCIRNPFIPDEERNFIELTTRINEDVHSITTVQGFKLYALKLFLSNCNRLTLSEFLKQMKSFNNHEITEMTNLCKIYKNCKNPAHTSIPLYHKEENYKEMLFKLFCDTYKNLIFDENDQAKLNSLNGKKKKTIKDKLSINYLNKKKRICTYIK